MKALTEGVAATQRSVELALTQYREGAIDFNRVFNLQSTLVQQQDQLAATQAEVAKSLIRIYKSLGGGWQLRLQNGDGVPGDDEALDPPVPSAPRANQAPGEFAPPKPQ